MGDAFPSWKIPPRPAHNTPGSNYLQNSCHLPPEKMTDPSDVKSYQPILNL